MARLPLIIGMGGINAAGRTSFHQGFRRIVIDKLNAQARQETFVGLASLMNIVSYQQGTLVDVDGNTVAPSEIEAKFGQQILAGTLIRKIEKNHFDPDATHWHQKMNISPTDKYISFELLKKELPKPVPSSWLLTDIGEARVAVKIPEQLTITHDAYRDNPIKAAGQFPTGFDPAKLYKSRYQPRGLQATIFAATDAIRSTGIEWDAILDKISPDEVGVYSASIAGQLNDEGLGGLIKSRLTGSRVSTKQLALGLNTMSTDFINAYVIGNVGTTFTSSGACATFLYNLRAAVHDMAAGRIRVAIVGSSEAAITPEVIEGFGNMSALANEEGLKRLDGTDTADHRRTSRPFGKNCGFTIGEGAQFVILMDDALALAMGAKVLASVADVFINADGYKKSITAPGPGNYITMAKSVALAEQVLGKEALQQRSFILAHGSSTPQNRVTESLIYHRVAECFNIENWPVAAPKAYVGHTLGPASGDQMAMALGVFSDNIMPGITTIDKVADDVHDQHLNIATEHWYCHDMDIAFINSKGFGGNNATATIFSPKVTLAMMEKRYGAEAMQEYQQKLISVEQAQQVYRDNANNGQFDLIYKFGEGLINEDDIELTTDKIKFAEFKNSIALPTKNPFDDMV
ncbi:beta-ketoacyl synthase [Colwellia sp. MT41]|uniref:Beta-ketoacyl-[acyl-carrier-protein] synthase FabY n=1 Tax=Colwellia marinimaniae TaxID=1513592 RepID=A0ABQ0MZN8_9GAMM|nr:MULTISPECIES: beta-ketoacyl synthase [Colwellia]ALO36249.1 beta-ketoacyl synthase [Colwellia sp. MT41]GAW97825.1 beta-ketoacyl-[acyl-carrier-protein] synthase FabY [Colwellia marinimaniae]